VQAAFLGGLVSKNLTLPDCEERTVPNTFRSAGTFFFGSLKLPVSYARFPWDH
jgi:hypothetical protein